jgi:hypothetical protein
LTANWRRQRAALRDGRIIDFSTTVLHLTHP